MSSTTTSGSTLGVLTRQEIRNYLKHKLFWFGAAITVLYIVLIAVDSDETFGETTTLYMIAPAAALGVLGLVTMFGLTRRSDRAAEAAGAVAVPERTRTLALASAVVVPASLAFVAFLVAVVFYYVDPPESHTVWPEISDLYVHATQFGGGVMCAIGGPLLGLLLARYLPKRGVAVVAAVVLVLIKILMQGLFEGGQPYRVFWFWTYFHGPYSADSDHWTRLPGNPFIWVAYLAVVCVLGVVTAVYHDPESNRPTLKKLAFGLLVVAIVLGVLSMTVGYPEIIHNPLPGEF